jgi:hypothetical protein
MEPSIDFSKHYVVYGHGVRDVDAKDTSNPTSHFTLDSNYRIVTLHMPGKEIFKELVRIILNKISTKSTEINDLFLISCPIARKTCKERLENELIKGYFLGQFQTNSEKTTKELSNIINSFDDFDSDNESEPSHETRTSFDMNLDSYQLKFSNQEELKNYLEVNIAKIKRLLNFEIRLYRPGEQCPKLRLDFKIVHSLSLLKGGIFPFENFQDFNLDLYELSLSSSQSEKINSLVKFNDKVQYVFDDADIDSNKLSFFKTIKPIVPTGTLVVLACGSYDLDFGRRMKERVKEKNTDSVLQLVRTKSISGQEATFRKYFIKYD